MLIGETEQDHTARRLIMSSTCEMFGCRRPAHKLYSVAPGTNLWLCKSCAETEGWKGITMIFMDQDIAIAR